MSRDTPILGGINFGPFQHCEAHLDPRALRPPEKRPITEEDEARWAEQTKGTQLEGITLRALEEMLERRSPVVASAHIIHNTAPARQAGRKEMGE